MDVVEIRTGSAASQAECAAFNEDEQADGDEDHGQQDVSAVRCFAGQFFATRPVIAKALARWVRPVSLCP
ncbi:hypothetical protein ABZ281_47805 [Streptomyces sp. NPDC006265]|uniref:hypothetical protein n=1 Tax=Streptomyces sp. NPDC006265 TaxID=3156740 RepID=UPI0033AECB1F